MMAATVAIGHDVHFAVGLPQRNVDILKQAVINMSDYKHQDYGKFWSIDRVLDLIAPCPSINRKVNEHLTSRNITCVDYRDSMVCTGNESTVYPLFRMNTQTGEHIIPESLKGLVNTIEFRVNKPNEIRPIVSRSAKSADPGYFGVESCRKLYNYTDTWTFEGVVAVEYQGSSGFSNEDLELSQLQNGLKINPITSDHNIGTDVYPDTETELDVQMLTYANNSTVWFWGSNQWLWTWAVDFFNTPVIPYVASHSWGWAIDQQCTIDQCNTTDQAYVDRVNVEYLKIAARGATLLVASGDSGAPGRTDEVCLGVNRTVVSIFPGSSPYVLSVGATFVVGDSHQKNTNWTTPLCQKNGCTTGQSEAVVNLDDVGWTSGGGFGVDPTEVQPVWQTMAVDGYFAQNPPLPTNFNPLGRAYPDLSVVGHNCPTWQGGIVSQVDGTSCSSPLMGSIIAVINSHQMANGKARLGLAAPILYAMYYDDPTIFNDITVGNNWCTETMCCSTRPDGGSNYGYVATKGFDPVTGLGTPNVGKILSWLDKNT